MKDKWTDEEISILKTFYPYGWRRVQEELSKRNYNRTMTAILWKAQSLGLSKPKGKYVEGGKQMDVSKVEEEMLSLFTGEEEKELINSFFGKETFNWETLKDFQKLVKTFKVEVKEEVIKTDIPIGIVFLGDFHIGHIGVDYEALKEDVNTLRNARNIKILMLGDYCEFGKTIRKSLDEDFLRASVQLRIFSHILNALKDKIIGMVCGTHESFILKQTGIDLLEHWCETNNIPYFKYGSRLNLRLNDILYVITFRHEFPKFESNLNTTNALRRMLELYEDFDIGVLAHKHKGVLHIEDIKEKQRVFLRIGSYKVKEDAYAEFKGFKVDTKIYMPMVILYPDVKRIDAFRDFREGLQYLYFLENKYKKSDVNVDTKEI